MIDPQTSSLITLIILKLIYDLKEKKKKKGTADGIKKPRQDETEPPPTDQEAECTWQGPQSLCRPARCLQMTLVTAVGPTSFSSCGDAAASVPPDLLSPTHLNPPVLRIDENPARSPLNLCCHLKE